jgi:hypothetical protein
MIRIEIEKGLVWILAATGVMMASAHAAGPKRLTDSATLRGEEAASAANPIRQVEVLPVYSRSFQLPNGVRVQIDPYLQDFVRVALSETPNLRARSVVAAPEASSCERTLKIEARLAAIELGVKQYGLTFGYSPGGELATPGSLTGQVEVQVGTVIMTFHLLECSKEGSCLEVASSLATQATSQTQAGLQVNFAELQGSNALQAGLQFLFKTELHHAFKKVIQTGIRDLASRAATARTPWRGRVLAVDPERGTVTLDAGFAQNLRANQRFTVFAAMDGDASSDTCTSLVHLPLARVRTTDRLEMDSAPARIESVESDHRPIRSGDEVRITP